MLLDRVKDDCLEGKDSPHGQDIFKPEADHPKSVNCRLILIPPLHLDRRLL